MKKKIEKGKQNPAKQKKFQHWMLLKGEIKDTSNNGRSGFR